MKRQYTLKNDDLFFNRDIQNYTSNVACYILSLAYLDIRL